jgi:HEPN domain-containing protein
MTNITVKSVEEYLEFLKEVATKGGGNVPIYNKKNKKDYRNALNKIDYYNFVQSADYHYFISRILFLHYITDYAQFSGYQCIENYLKAYLKFKGEVPPDKHDLQLLLQLCRAKGPIAPFINSDNIVIIIAKYAPFYELARYPVQHEHPKSGYALVIPDDIYILDYFVMKMREILVVPTNTWDIFKDGHFKLHQCQQNFPDFYNTFFENNINFTERKS